MNPSTEDYAQLAKDSYQNRPEYAANTKRQININDHEYKVIDYQASPSGFHATAYMQVDAPHGIVIAYRGTDPDHLLTTVQDASVDAIMVGGEVNPQIRDAERFTERVLDKARQQGISIESITVTGHSLGGTLAEVAAWKYGLHGQTFNAFGAAELNLGIPEGGSQIINNVLDADPVSAGGHHFGMVRHYATVEDIDSLRAAGYLEGQRGVASAWRAMRFADHSIDNFAPDAGQGPSVLNPANEARAKEYAVAIAAFREDVHDARAGLHVAMQPGMPLVGLHTLAWGVEGLTAAGLATSEALEKTREAIEREALRGAHAAEQAAQQVVRQATQTYEATRTTVLEGVRAGEQVAHDVHDAVRREVVRGIDAAEHAVHTATERASDALDVLRHPGQWFDHPSAPAHLNQPAHPDHALFLQARHGVHQIDAEHGRTPDQHSDNLAAALTVQARHKNMSHIDQVALSPDGTRAFAVQNGVVIQHAQVPTAEAVQTSIAQSSATWQQIMQHQQQAQPSMEPAMLPPSPAQGMGR